LEGHVALSWKSKEMTPFRKSRPTLEYSKSYKNRPLELGLDRTRLRKTTWPTRVNTVMNHYENKTKKRV
jgi:hypothetical protein